MLLSKKRHALVTIVFALVAFVDIRTVRGLEFDALATNAGSNERLHEAEQVRVLKSEKSSKSSKSEDEKEKKSKSDKKSKSYDTVSSRGENIEPVGKQRLSSRADYSSQMFAHARVDEIPEPRISIGRPTNIIGSSPATTPGSGGGSVPLSFFDTQYNTNAARPGSNSYLFPQPGGSNPVTPAPRPVTPAPRPVTPVNPVPRPANTGVFVPLDRPGTTLAELSASPTDEPSTTPTDHPTPNPTPQPTPAPTPRPTRQPTLPPTGVPTVRATPRPTRVPTPDPTRQPTKEPTRSPSASPSASPVTWLGGVSRPGLSTGASGGFGQFQRPAPTDTPSSVPTDSPSMRPSPVESSVPSSTPSVGEVITIETESTEVESEETESTEAESTETEQATDNPTERPTTRPTGGGNAYGWPTFSPTTWLPTTTFQPTILYPWLKPANHFHDEDDADSRVDLNRGGGSSLEDLNDNAANTPQSGGVVSSASVIAPTPYPTQPAVSLPGSGVSLPVDRPGNFLVELSPSPTDEPSATPTDHPTPYPTYQPTPVPTPGPTREPTLPPTGIPTVMPTPRPTVPPTLRPTGQPSTKPTPSPSKRPTPFPTTWIESIGRDTVISNGGFNFPTPSELPSDFPSSMEPSLVLADGAVVGEDADSRVDLNRGGGSSLEDLNDNAANTPQSSGGVSSASVIAPTPYPTQPAVSLPGSGVSLPVDRPGNFLVELSPSPTDEPSATPTDHPTPYPTYQPTPVPTPGPTREPTLPPTGIPTVMPTPRPTVPPTLRPTGQPSTKPTPSPSKRPTPFPTTWIESIGRDTVISNGGFNFPTPSELPSDFPSSMEPSLVLADTAAAQQWHQNQGGRRTSTEGKKLEE